MDKSEFSPNAHRLKINKILQSICLLSGIAWFALVSVCFYNHENKFDFYIKYVAPQSITALVLIVVFYIANFILFKIFGTDKVNIDDNVKNISIIIFDTVLRAVSLLFIGYLISALTFLFWSNLILN